MDNVGGDIMHECLLCERDMKKSKTTFGSGCINHIFNFLDMEKPKRVKNKENLLYKNIMKRTNTININQTKECGWQIDI